MGPWLQAVHQARNRALIPSSGATVSQSFPARPSTLHVHNSWYPFSWSARQMSLRLEPELKPHHLPRSATTSSWICSLIKDSPGVSNHYRSDPVQVQSTHVRCGNATLLVHSSLCCIELKATLFAPQLSLQVSQAAGRAIIIGAIDVYRSVAVLS